MPNLKCAVAFIAVGLTFSSASAATLTATIFKENKTVVSLNGKIVEGDADKLKEIIRSENRAVRLVSALRFNSPGGLLLEGVKLAAIIRYAKISTIVVNGARCASACFIAFAAGSQKFASNTARIGVHGASDSRGQEAGDTLNATVSMARIVKELGVPEGIIEKMVVTRASEIAWLNPNDLRSMGVAMTAKPDQIASDQSTVSHPPMQLPSVPATRVVLPPLRFPSAQSAPPVDEYCAARAGKLKELVRRTYSGYASYYVDKAFLGFCDPVTGYMSDYIEKASRTVIPLLPWPKSDGETLKIKRP
jgi:hypothetical protein